MLSERGDGSSMATFLRHMGGLPVTMQLLPIEEKCTEGLDPEFVSRLRLYSVVLAQQS